MFEGIYQILPICLQVCSYNSGLDDVISHYSHLSDGLPTPLLLAVKAPSLKYTHSAFQNGVLNLAQYRKPTDGNNKLATACLKGDAKAFKFVHKIRLRLFFF